MTASRLSASIALLANAIIGLGGATQAQTEERHRDALSGQAVLVNNESEWNSRCQWIGNPSYDFVQNPSHGSISTRQEVKIIKSCQAGGFCECLGRQITGLAVYYTSQPGFHGRDALKYTSKFNNGDVLDHNITIEVR
jgi:hypothetical protein